MTALALLACSALQANGSRPPDSQCLTSPVPPPMQEYNGVGAVPCTAGLRTLIGVSGAVGEQFS